MGIIRIAAIPCSHCGERSWFVREPKEKRVTREILVALALAPVRILDAAVAALAERPTRSYQARVDEGLKAAALQKPRRVRGVKLEPNEMMCATCGYRVYNSASEPSAN